MKNDFCGLVKNGEGRTETEGGIMEKGRKDAGIGDRRPKNGN